MMITIKPSAIYNTRIFFENIINDFSAEILDLKIEHELPVAFWDSTSLHKLVFNQILSFVSDHHRLNDEKILIRIQTIGSYKVLITIATSGMKISSNQWDKLCERDGLLNTMKCCLQAHNGFVDLADIPEKNRSMINIQLPLYSLCMQ